MLNTSLTLSCSLLLCFSSLTWAADATDGDVAFKQGDFQKAAEIWQAAQQALSNQASAERVKLLMRLGAAYQHLGMHTEVLNLLQEAILLADELNEAELQSQVLTQSSDGWLAVGEIGGALSMAKDSESIARTLNNPRLLAGALNNKGNAQSALGLFEESEPSYQEAEQLAKQAGDALLQGKILLNYADAAFSAGELDKFQAHLQALQTQVKTLPASYDKNYILISMGLLAERWLQYHLREPQNPQTAVQLQTLALQVYQQAAKEAEQLGDVRTASMAFGYLGALYEQQQAIQTAQPLTRQAVFYARQIYAPDILYRWEWQLGRQLNAAHQFDDAIAAYQRSLAILEPIQNNLELGYRTSPDDFNSAVRPVYYELADLLLRKAETASPVDAQTLMFEAQNTVEKVKRVELENYFQDQCVAQFAAKARALDEVDPHTAIIYPMPLPERLVVLLGIAGEWQQFSTPVKGAKVDEVVRDFRRRLQTRPDNGFLYNAWQLYDWLIRPLRPTLESHQVDTLVVVPDAALRMIPFSTLNDGQHFLIEDYALALTPGLTLTDPQALNWKEAQVLLLGLADAVQDYPPLPGVPSELQSIQSLTGGDKLLNGAYSTEAFRDKLQAKEYSVIHMATHGEFSSDPEHTYLLTYESKLTINKLQDVIGLGKFREKPIELLTLSACRTAVGDDRAALGLAGVAVKAGARSALASLWFVDDEATSGMMKDFYREVMNDPNLTKAKALRKVQLKLIAQDRYWHPSYWAPFLLIGNWL